MNSMNHISDCAARGICHWIDVVDKPFEDTRQLRPRDKDTVETEGDAENEWIDNVDDVQTWGDGGNDHTEMGAKDEVTH